MERDLFLPIQRDLERKMVFLGGPRQCGKTYLARQLLASAHSELNYYNWDLAEHRKIIQDRSWSQGRLIVLDEIHKNPKWKNLVKGYYDTQGGDYNFLITGSARLDVYKRGGDSLFGRYHYWRIHPFTLDEVRNKIDSKIAFKKIMTVGGFPEPFLEMDESSARRWRKERFDRIIREDVRDLEKVVEVQNILLLLDLLKTRVGQLIVVSNLAKDLQVSSNTVKRWIEILQRLYVIFVVKPHTMKLARSIQKPFKIYFFDTADVEGDDGTRYENLVACHLLKWLNFKEDNEGIRCELNFIRDKDGREIDFAIVQERRLISLIETKWADSDLSKSLLYYSEKLNINQAIQLVANSKREYKKGKLNLVSAISFLSHQGSLSSVL